MSKATKHNHKLEFEPIDSTSRTQRATLSFENGYGCNIYLHSPNTNKWLPYEFELTKNGKQTFHGRISDSNVGFCNEDDINEFIKIAEKL